MGLNNIQLPASTIVDLYKNMLCEDDSAKITDTVRSHFTEDIQPTKQEAAASIVPQQINFLGKNLMQLVILVDYNGEVYLPETQLNFIGNILKACKMNLADVAIVNVNKQQVTIDNLSQQLDPKYLVIFGINTTILKINKEVSTFNIVTTDFGIQLFTSPSLEQLNQETENGKLLKSKLWLCMKKMLNL